MCTCICLLVFVHAFEYCTSACGETTLDATIEPWECKYTTNKPYTHAHTHTYTNSLTQVQLIHSSWMYRYVEGDLHHRIILAVVCPSIRRLAWDILFILRCVRLHANETEPNIDTRDEISKNMRLENRQEEVTSWSVAAMIQSLHNLINKLIINGNRLNVFYFYLCLIKK